MSEQTYTCDTCGKKSTPADRPPFVTEHECEDCYRARQPRATFHVEPYFSGKAKMAEVVMRMDNNPKTDRQLCLCRREADANMIAAAMKLLAKSEKVHP